MNALLVMLMALLLVVHDITPVEIESHTSLHLIRPYETRENTCTM